jgi:hypothetical protein
LYLSFFSRCSSAGILKHRIQRKSVIKPVHKPTKSELKKQKKLSKDSYDPIDVETIEVAIGIKTKILPNGKKLSLIKVEFKRTELFFKESIASINIFGKITSNDMRVDGIFEEAVNFTSQKEQIDQPNTLFYQKFFELPSGKYTLRFAVRDTQTGIVGYRAVKFEVN